MHDMIERLCVWRHLKSTRHQKREGKVSEEERGAGKIADVISMSVCCGIKVGEGVIRPGRYIKRVGECSRAVLYG